MQLLYLFFYTLCLTLLISPLFPFWHLLYCAPFLVLCFYRCSLANCLCWSLLCGFIIDLFSADTRLGNYAMNYCIVTFSLYRYRFHFFEDRLSTLPAVTFCFTGLSTLIQIVIFYIISRPFALSWHWLFYDLLWVSLQTALYAILAFTIPSFILIDLKRRVMLFRLSRRRL